MRSLRKIPTRLRGTNFCTSSARFAPSFIRQPNIPNAPKWYEMHQNISLGSNGVDRVPSLQKIPTRQTAPNAPKWYKTHQNIILGSNGVDRVRSFRKIPTRFRGTNFCTSSARFAPRFVWQPNGSKCTQIVRIAENISLGSNGVDRVRSLRKILMRLRGTNFCTSSACFAPSF